MIEVRQLQGFLLSVDQLTNPLKEKKEKRRVCKSGNSSVSCSQTRIEGQTLKHWRDTQIQAKLCRYGLRKQWVILILGKEAVWFVLLFVTGSLCEYLHASSESFTQILGVTCAHLSSDILWPKLQPLSPENNMAMNNIISNAYYLGKFYFLLASSQHSSQTAALVSYTELKQRQSQNKIMGLSVRLQFLLLLEKFPDITCYFESKETFRVYKRLKKERM